MTKTAGTSHLSLEYHWSAPRYRSALAGFIRPMFGLLKENYADSDRLRTNLRLPATNADVTDVTRPLYARLRHRHSRSPYHQAEHPNHFVSRCLRQLVQPDRRTEGGDSALSGRRRE